MLRRLCPLALFAVSICLNQAWSGEVRIGGRALLPGGEPLPEAEVVLLPLGDSLEEARSALLGESPDPAARALTGADGRFDLRAPGAGLWRVRIDAPGFVPVQADLKPLLDTVELPDAELSSDAGITVRVQTAKGVPVSGAHVLLDSDRSRFAFGGGAWSFPVRFGVTGEDGSLRLTRGARERVALSVSAEGQAYRELRGLYGTSARVTLTPGSSRSIEVRSSSGETQPDVLVALGQRPHPLGVTDGQGRFSLRVENSGTNLLTLRAEDGRRLETRLSRAVGDRPTRLVLPDRLAVAGRVIDSDSRRAIEGGLVWDHRNPLGAAVTDRAGGFVLGGSAGERLSITAGATGYLPSHGFDFQLMDDGRAGPTLVLRPAAAIEGKVVSDVGEVLAGAEVELAVRRQPGLLRIEIGRPRELPRTLTSSQGTFHLGPLDPEQSYDIKVRAEGYAPAEMPVTGLEPYRTKSGLRIEMSLGHEIAGKVVDLEGQPIRDAAVSLRPSRGEQGHGMIRMVEGEETEGIRSVSGEDGRFSIPGVPAGKFDLQASRSGFARRDVPAIEVEEESETVDVGEIVLQPGESLDGFVRGRDGQPLEGVEVFLDESGPMMMVLAGPGPGEPEAETTTEVGGWFTVEDLKPGGKYSLRFRRSGFQEKNVSAVEVPRPEPLEVVLDPSSVVSGVVLDADGEPVAGAQVTLSRERTVEMGGSVMVTMMAESDSSDAEGRFLFDDEEPGRISLEAVAAGYQKAELNHLEIPTGEDLEGVEITVPDGAVLVGRVLAPDGRPAIGARVSPVSGSREMMIMNGNATDGDGRYRVEGLAPGPVSIQAEHKDYPRAVRDIELREGRNSLDLQFEGGQDVTGRVTSVSGDAVADAAVRLNPVGRYWGGPETRTESDGSFTMSGVQDGQYRLWAESEGYAPSAGTIEVRVEGEPVQGLEIRLDPGGAIYGRISGLEPEQFRTVQVSAEGTTPRGFRQSGVDYQGNYRLEHLLPGTYGVNATMTDSGRQATGQATLDPGAQETRLDLQFSPGLTLSGSVVQGELPVAGATVFTEGIDLDHTGWSQTDLQGWFSIEGLEPGSYRLSVRNFQTGLAHDETVQLSTSREIVVELPTATVSGRVVDASDRRPLSGVTLVLDTADDSSRGMFPTHTATTDLEGRFRIRSIADGNWRLTANREDYAAVSLSVTVQQGTDVDGLQLSMDATEGLTLEARLPTGSPPTELAVAVLDPAGGALVAGHYATGESGRVRLSEVPAGNWELVISAAGSATANLSARAPGPAVPVVLQPATSLHLNIPELSGSDTVATVRIAAPDGRPYRALSWSAQPQSEWRMTGGGMEFRSLPPGSWTVSVTAPDGRTWQGSTSTSVGVPADLTLE